MNKVSKNTTFKIYYKADDLLTGQNVSYYIWGDNGIVYANNVPATAEIGTHGVYYLEFTSPNIDTYLLCKVGLSNGTYIRSLIIMCGDPLIKKLFYVDEQFRFGLTTSFQIFDLIGNTIASGNLIDTFNGFYSVSVEGLTDGTYFFKVDPYVSKFLIPLEYEFQVGDCVASIEYKYVMVNVSSSYGGASKSRHSIFDYEGEMTKRKIHAHLKNNSDEKNAKGAISSLKKEEDNEKDIKASLKNSEAENMLTPVNVDYTLGPKKQDEKKSNSVNRKGTEYIDKTNVINFLYNGI